MQQETHGGAKTKPKETKDFLEREEFTLRKRLPPKLPKRKDDVYVTRKTDFQAQMKRCQNILDSGNEVYIHGLGAAVNRAINLALQLKANGRGTIDVSCRTSTVELTDDLEPNNDETEADTSLRNNSAVHIKVYRPQSPNEEVQSSVSSP
ncbi:ribonuclease P protein subunit p20-like [Haliotis rubra]|uniref:ribonuclease P protein subunit p20-like n=1 Tax=Haliotis rubra TaxID=36100 RepID=UPI001EE60A07|nr:ribonuclease P protein subunit p20-like [Haliotis rubra]